MTGPGRRGAVVVFDEERGWGTVRTADGDEFWFHCTAIAGGTRSIEEGTRVMFEVVAGHLGRWEAVGIRPVDA